MFSWNCSEKYLTEMVILLAYLIGTCVRVFLDKVFQPKAVTVVHSVPKKVMYFCLPFTGSHSLHSGADLGFFVR